MVDFVSKTYEELNKVLFDAKMSVTGEWIIPGPNPANTWFPHRRDGAGNYVAKAAPSSGSTTAGGVGIDASELYAYVSTANFVYRFKRANLVADEFAYAPDNWNVNVGGTVRGMDVNPANTSLAVGVADQIKVYNTATKALRFSLDLGTLVEFCLYSPSGNYLLAGDRTGGLHLWHVVSDTHTKITTGSFAAYTQGNWGATWHADEDKFVANAYLAGADNGAWVYLLTDAPTHTFTRQPQTIFDSPPVATVGVLGCAFLNRTTMKDYLILANYGTYAPRVYFWDGAGFVEQATTGLGAARTYEGFSASGSGNEVFFFDSLATPKNGVWQFDGFTGETLTVEADFPFADFDATGTATYVANISGDLPFADFDANALTGANANISGDLPFADVAIIVAAADGVAPGDNIRATAAQIFTGAVGTDTSSVVATDFAYVYHQDFPFADFDMSVLAGADLTVNDDLPFADIDILVIGAPEVNIEADFPFADFNGEVFTENRSVEISADLPFADFDATFYQLPEVTIDADLPFADFDATFFHVLTMAVSANLPFGDFDALFAPPSTVDIEADFPFADLDAEVYVYKFDADIEADLPFADFDVITASPLWMALAADFPFADFDASAHAPLGVTVSGVLPGYDTEIDVAVPLWIDLNSVFPGYDFDGQAKQVIFSDIEADLPFADFDVEISVLRRTVNISADLPFGDLNIAAVTSAVQVVIPPIATDRRKTFWTTQPNACGTAMSNCGDECGVPGLALSTGSGKTLATNDWIRGLLLNIFGTNARMPATECGVMPGTQQGHWSESYRADGLHIGTKVRYQKSTGRILDAVSLLRAQALVDANKLVSLGVALSVDVKTTYKGGNKVSVEIHVIGPSSREDVVNLSATRLQNQWVWS